jgi:hypothetical protein
MTCEIASPLQFQLCADSACPWLRNVRELQRCVEHTVARPDHDVGSRGERRGAAAGEAQRAAGEDDEAERAGRDRERDGGGERERGTDEEDLDHYERTM